MKKLLVLRISLVLAITALLAVLAMAHLVLRPKIETLGRERDSLRNASEQNLTRATKAEIHVRQLSKELEEAAAQKESALHQTERITAENSRLLIDLEETRAALHSTKQHLARWNATGTTADQVASLARENKALATQLSQLQTNYDRLARDFANLQRTLEISPPDSVELPPMHGSVLVVDPKWNFVVLNLGEANGLVKNGVLMITRDSKLIGKAKIRRVESNRSIADLLPEWRLAEVREGDQVMN